MMPDDTKRETGDGDRPRTHADEQDAALDPAACAVLDFWFGQPGTPRYGQASESWFMRDDAFDALIRERFGATLAAARRGECDDWQRTPLGALALVIPTDLAGLYGERPAGRLAQLARVSNRKLFLAVEGGQSLAAK